MELLQPIFFIIALCLFFLLELLLFNDIRQKDIGFLKSFICHIVIFFVCALWPLTIVFGLFMIISKITKRFLCFKSKQKSRSNSFQEERKISQRNGSGTHFVST